MLWKLCEYLKTSADFNLYKIEEFSNNEILFFLLSGLYQLKF